VASGNIVPLATPKPSDSRSEDRQHEQAEGAAAGKALLGTGKDLPPRICAAISPSEVYLFGMKTHGTSLDPIAKIDRDKLGVEVHQRMTVRTIVLEDLETGHQFPLEAPKLNLYHAKATVEEEEVEASRLSAEAVTD